MENFKVEVRSGDNAISAEGSAAFIKEALEWWKDLSASAQAEVVPTSEIKTSLASPTQSVAATGHQAYPSVYDSADGKLKIIAHISGKNKAEQTRQTALVLLFGKLLDGEELVPSELVREACTDQGCYDPTNFAQYVRGLKSKVVMNTKPGGGYDIKLTAPGRKEAKEVVEILQQASQ